MLSGEAGSITLDCRKGAWRFTADAEDAEKTWRCALCVSSAPSAPRLPAIAGSVRRRRVRAQRAGASASARRHPKLNTSEPRRLRASAVESVLPTTNRFHLQ